MAKIATPFPWFGGKAAHTAWILRYVPPHTRYIELFGGSGALLFAKDPVPYEVYNDLDEGLIGFFRVLRDPALFPEFFRRVQLWPYSRAEFEEARQTWADQTDPVERALRWYVVARQAFSGNFPTGGFKVAYHETANGRAADVHKWQSALQALPAFHARILRVVIEHQDWRDLLPLYDTPDTLWYCDPPYVPETRRSGTYQHELTTADHDALVDRLMTVTGMVILSGYAHPLYDPLVQAGWRKVVKEVPLRANNRRLTTGQRRAEVLWINPAAWQRQSQVTWEEVIADGASAVDAPLAP
jgi:DNA adenine methylase